MIANGSASAVNRRVVGSSPTCGANIPREVRERGHHSRGPFVFCDFECAVTSGSWLFLPRRNETAHPARRTGHTSKCSAPRHRFRHRLQQRRLAQHNSLAFARLARLESEMKGTAEWETQRYESIWVHRVIQYWSDSRISNS
jgi:hypothetical protein